MLEDGWSWNMHILAGLLCLVLLYGVLLKETTSYIKPSLFLVGISLFYLLIGSPLAAISELSFSLHMIQMSFLYFIVPPLLLLGIPYDMFERLFTKINKRSFLSSTHALYLFSFLLFMYHLPFILNILLQHDTLLTMYKLILFFLAVGMWWPIAAPNSNIRQSADQMKRYVFKCGLLITPACLFFILTAFIDAESHSFLTQMSAHLCIVPSESFQILPPFFQSKTDQFLAGICMFGLHKFGLLMTNKLARYT